MKLFELGQIVATPGVLDACTAEQITACLHRHGRGDWGTVDEEDRAANDEALASGHRLMSVYPLAEPAGTVWVITEWDRSVTTLLLPSEY